MSRFRAAACAFVIPILLASAASAQVLSLDYSNDVSWKVGAALAPRAGVVRQAPPSSAITVDLGLLPANADLVAFAVGSDGKPLFVLDTALDLPGGVYVEPADVVRYSGGTYSVVLNGGSADVPKGAVIDGLDFRRGDGANLYYLSFDVAIILPGPLFADRRDVVVWNGSSWSKVFDGGAHGVPVNLDVDAVSVDRYDPAGTVFYLSFDGSGRIGSVNFDDEDVVVWNGSAWSHAFDGSTQSDPTFAAGDMDALQVLTPNVFRDGFESSDRSEWSTTTG